MPQPAQGGASSGASLRSRCGRSSLIHPERAFHRSLQELPGELVRGLLHLRLGALFDNVASMQEDDVISDFENRLDVVTDNDRAAVVPLLNFLDQLAEERGP